MDANTLFLRLEGPLQSWGAQESKFVIRRTAEAPTKSGVIGLLCAALGVSRTTATDEWLPRLATLRMGVRIDRAGVRWWDYHTVGAHLNMRTAKGESRPGALLSRREYLSDASFLVALQGEPRLIEQLEKALRMPAWTLYLGRKCCPPSLPVIDYDAPENRGSFPDLSAALGAVPWRPRLKDDTPPEYLTCLIEWQSDQYETEAPEKAEIWYDVPRSFEPPYHEPRFVMRGGFTTGTEGQIITGLQRQNPTPHPLRPRANYTNSHYRAVRKERLKHDGGLCVLCKAPATTVQHITYRHAGGDEAVEELRSLCRLCHDAVTMIEYGAGMGLDRINPEDQRWRSEILRQRAEIIGFRSLEMRRRRLDSKEVE